MKKSAKRIIMLIIACILTLSFAACSNSTDTSSISSVLSTGDTSSVAKVDLNVIGLKGPTGMGMAKLMSENEAGTTTNNYKFTISADPADVMTKIIAGTVDIAAVPTNLASLIYKKSGNIKVAALNTLGVLYMLENGNTINSLADLKGKTIYSSGQGSTPEYILNYILKSNGIDPEKDVKIVYKAEHSELATLMASNEIVLGVLPEPNVTIVMSSNANVRIALNLTDEWNKIAAKNGDGSTLTMGCVVVRQEIIDQHPEAVEAFLNEYKASIEYTNANIDEASTLIETYGIIAKAALAKKAIPNSNICYVDGADMKTQLSGFLKVLFNANPASIGGAMPDDSFYYSK